MYTVVVIYLGHAIVILFININYNSILRKTCILMEIIRLFVSMTAKKKKQFSALTASSYPVPDCLKIYLLDSVPNSVPHCLADSLTPGQPVYFPLRIFCSMTYCRQRNITAVSSNRIRSVSCQPWYPRASKAHVCYKNNFLYKRVSSF